MLKVTTASRHPAYRHTITKTLFEIVSQTAILTIKTVDVGVEPVCYIAVAVELTVKGGDTGQGNPPTEKFHPSQKSR